LGIAPTAPLSGTKCIVGATISESARNVARINTPTLRNAQQQQLVARDGIRDALHNTSVRAVTLQPSLAINFHAW
jgi:hypothetical protein